MYPAGTGWWNVPEGVTIPVLSLSMAWCENTPGSDMGLWIMWLPIPLWHQSTLSNKTQNTALYTTPANHPFSSLNVCALQHFLKVAFAQLAAPMHPPAWKLRCTWDGEHQKRHLHIELLHGRNTEPVQGVFNSYMQPKHHLCSFPSLERESWHLC